MFGRAKSIVQFVFGAACHQFFQLRNERRDADATCHQNVAFAALGKGKQILRLGNVDVVAHVQGVMHVYRAAFAFHIFAHTDFVFRQLRG